MRFYCVNNIRTMNNRYSSLLYARPSFFEGMARLFDFGNFLTEYNHAPSGRLADYLALEADYAAVSDDMRAVFADYLRAHPLLNNGNHAR